MFGCIIGGLVESGRKWPPIAPIGVDQEANIRLAEGHWNPIWFRNQVENRGPWDYKQIDRIYEDFGNFNYGVTGTAFGFPASVLLNEAGRAQIRDKNPSPDWGKPGPPGLPQLGSPPYGDDPKDQYWIEQGIDYYKNRQHWSKPIQFEPP